MKTFNQFINEFKVHPLAKNGQLEYQSMISPELASFITTSRQMKLNAKQEMELAKKKAELAKAKAQRGSRGSVRAFQDIPDNDGDYGGEGGE